MIANRWISARARSATPRLRLFAFPYAGRGASTYAAWAAAFAPTVELCAVQLPGREDRSAEPLVRRMDVVVERFLAEAGQELTTPFAFFGHSLGGLVAYEIARRLQRRGARGPELLFVSASPPPDVPDKAGGVHELDDERFLAEVRRWNGTPERVLSDPALVQLLLPVLRADLELLQHYYLAPSDDAKLDARIVAIGGTRDPRLDAAGLAQWRSFTRDRFELHMIDGDHFFVNGSRRQVRQLVAAALAESGLAAA